MKRKERKWNKKAVLFSLISVLFAVLFITLYSQKFSTVSEDRIPGSNIRIKVMDTYVRNFEIYSGDSIKVSTYRTLDAITRYQFTKKQFLTDYKEFNTTFYNCMKCGYINCTNRIAANDCKLGQYYLEARLDNLSNISNDQLNIKTTYQINSISIQQRLAFEVEVKVNMSYNITDNSDGKYYAKWDREFVITQPLSIIGLPDPKGNINDSTDTYNRTIKRYAGICEYDEACWLDKANTIQFYIDKSFRLYRNSTSFLQRYWNDNNASNCCGIEAILYPSDLPAPADGNRSYIDHYYWNNTYSCSGGMTISTYLLNGDQVSLDSSTASRYGLTGSDISSVVCRP
jgi:hypothetical protein